MEVLKSSARCFEMKVRLSPSYFITSMTLIAAALKTKELRAQIIVEPVKQSSLIVCAELPYPYNMDQFNLIGE